MKDVYKIDDEIDADDSEALKVLEAAFLVNEQVVSLSELTALFSDDTSINSASAIKSLLQKYADTLENRPVELVEVAGGYRLQVTAEYSKKVLKMLKERPPKYSRAAMETLALIAYRQPVTRGEIESIRGVSVSTKIIASFMERGWIRILGQKETPGRPALYGTTQSFLADFSLTSLKELPQLEPVPEVDEDVRDLFPLSESKYEEDEASQSTSIIQNGEGSPVTSNLGDDEITVNIAVEADNEERKVIDDKAEESNISSIDDEISREL